VLRTQLEASRATLRSKGSGEFKLHPLLELRITRLEKRLQLLESESQGKLDLSEFYAKPPEFTDEET